MTIERTNLGPEPSRSPRRKPATGRGLPPNLPPTKSIPTAAPDPEDELPILDTGFDGVTVQVMLITPDVARKFLEGRHANLQRAIRQKTIQKLVSDLNSGRFAFNGQSIVLDADGCMIDGQHRCEAIALSGVPAYMLVVRGVESSSFKTMDPFPGRRINDVIKGEGYANHGRIANALVLVWRYEQGQLLGLDSPTHAEATDLLAAHPGIVESLSRAATSARIIGSDSIATFFHYTFSKIDGNLADSFFDRLGTGVDLKNGNPILVLRNWFATYDGKDRRVRSFVFMVKAWNAIRQNRVVTKFVYGTNEPFPKIL